MGLPVRQHRHRPPWTAPGALGRKPKPDGGPKTYPNVLKVLHETYKWPGTEGSEGVPKQGSTAGSTVAGTRDQQGDAGKLRQEQVRPAKELLPAPAVCN